MQCFTCDCSATLFFHNTICLQCRREVGFCPVCRQMTPLLDAAGDIGHCRVHSCRTPLKKCHNYAVEGICNWFVAAVDAATEAYCESCRLTKVIPDLAIPDNKRRWADLEQAKRRVLYTLTLLGLDYSSASRPLTFEFKGDLVDSRDWRAIVGGEQVMTGHADGVVTINIREADSIQREQARVRFGEDLRTLVGHIRHECGHYYWQQLVAPARLDEFVAVFGNPHTPPYDQARDQYYANGPQVGWGASFVSAYATMHPWEDFAETFATYLDMAATLHTAAHAGFIHPIDLKGEIANLIETYQRFGVGINEVNREMGLLDPAPSVMSDTINGKLAFIHTLVINQ